MDDDDDASLLLLEMASLERFENELRLCVVEFPRASLESPWGMSDREEEESSPQLEPSSDAVRVMPEVAIAARGNKKYNENKPEASVDNQHQRAHRTVIITAAFFAPEKEYTTITIQKARKHR